MSNYNRIAVWEETVEQFRNDPIIPSHKLRFTDDLLERLSHIPKRFEFTKVEVVNYDIVDVALIEKYINGNKTLLLNMADISKPGGRVEEGSGAQEECLFRRSNYYKHLTSDHYPLLETDIVLSQNVKFIKQNENLGNPPMRSKYLDIMAIPAVRFPQVNKDMTKYLNYKDRWLMNDKIRTMFLLGIQYKYDVLVLSAFGCGAYGNPVKEVVDLFNNILIKYKGYFKKVVFAIIGMNNNYEHFKRLENIY